MAVDRVFEAYSTMRSKIEHVIESLPTGIPGKAVRRHVPARVTRVRATHLEQVFDKSPACD
jgi:hypothetical protein